MIEVDADTCLGCVLSLNPSAAGAATAHGSTKVNLNGCSLYDNSSNDTALTVGGSASVHADFVGVVGGLGSTSGITSTNGIRTHISPVQDPYADVPAPTATSGAGECGQRRSIPIRITNVAMATANVSHEALGTC